VVVHEAHPLRLLTVPYSHDTGGPPRALLTNTYGCESIFLFGSADSSPPPFALPPPHRGGRSSVSDTGFFGRLRYLPLLFKIPRFPFPLDHPSRTLKESINSWDCSVINMHLRLLLPAVMDGASPLPSRPSHTTPLRRSTLDAPSACSMMHCRFRIDLPQPLRLPRTQRNARRRGGPDDSAGAYIDPFYV